MLQQLGGSGPLAEVLSEALEDEVVETGRPLTCTKTCLEAGRLIAHDEEEGAHWVHLAEGWTTLRHLQSRDAQRPDVGARVVGAARVLLAIYHFRGHPNHKA